MLLAEACWWLGLYFFFVNDTATTEIYTLSLHDALPISPASACIFGAVAATYTGGTSRGACASAPSAGTFALHVEPLYSNASPPRTPRTISTASRIGPSVFEVCIAALLRKIFDVPKPRMNRPGPAASCTTRASIATCTGWRVNGEMIPQPIVSFSVSRAISAETTVEDRASIPCLRHQGYASASQIVSKPLRSSSRAVASISSSGSIVSCITPTRNGTATGAQFSVDVVGPSGSGSNCSGDHGLTPSSAPLVPDSGSASGVDSAGGP